MTENDTYLKLIKPTFTQLSAKIEAYSEEEWSKLSEGSLDEWLGAMGWTYEEYGREAKERRYHHE